MKFELRGLATERLYSQLTPRPLSGMITIELFTPLEILGREKFNDFSLHPF
jgi:hypothetical protein